MKRKCLRGNEHYKRVKRQNLRKPKVASDKVQQASAVLDSCDVSPTLSTSTSSEFSYHSSDALSSDNDTVEDIFHMEMERDEDLQSHFESSLCTKGRQACKTLQLRIASLCIWYSLGPHDLHSIHIIDG